PGVFGDAGRPRARGGGSNAVGRETDRGAMPRHRRPLNDDQLLPVGRRPPRVAGCEPDRRGGRSNGGGRLQAGPPRLLRTFHHWSTAMTNRTVTVYWSST